MAGKPEEIVHLFDAWAWPRLIQRLDEAGYVIIKKPTLIDKGVAKPRPHV